MKDKEGEKIQNSTYSCSKRFIEMMEFSGIFDVERPNSSNPYWDFHFTCFDVSRSRRFLHPFGYG